MIEITTEDVKEFLTSLVETEGEDYVYEAWDKNRWGKRCTYVKDGAGDCAVGRYLVYKGVSPERLQQFDQQEYAESAGDVLRTLKSEGVLTYDDYATSLLGGFQRDQDTGLNWGQCLSNAQHFFK